MTVYEKLAKVQASLKAPKSQHNKFGDFNYRSCEDILEAVKPLLQECKAILLLSDEIIPIGSRYYIKATATFQDAENPEAVNVSAWAREAEEKPKMDAAQITGSSSSYARKYALNGLFCIDDARDPDALPGSDQKTAARQQNRSRQQDALAQKQERRIDQEEITKLRAVADRKGVPDSVICQRYGKSNLQELSGLDYRRAMAGLNKMPDKMPEFMEYEQCEIPDDLPFR